MAWLLRESRKYTSQIGQLLRGVFVNREDIPLKARYGPFRRLSLASRGVCRNSDTPEPVGCVRPGAMCRPRVDAAAAAGTLKTLAPRDRVW